MKKQNYTSEYDLIQDNGAQDDAAQAMAPIFPLFRPVSGLYQWTVPVLPPLPVPIPPIIPPFPVPPNPPGPGASASEDAAFIPFPFRREDLRLDVDGRYPQHTASGTIYSLNAAVLHWIARLQPSGPATWSGPIWYKDGNASGFQYTHVEIKVTRGPLPFSFPVSAIVRYSGAGLAPLNRLFRYKSPYFRRVEFEFDCAQNTTPVLDIDTHAHPNRPATLPKETLTIQKVYQRTGFDVSTSTGPSIVPLTDAGANGLWSDQEMHDAMQSYWSRFANKPQWALWTLFAGQHEMGPSLGGIMFDDIGPNHRQGTSLFLNSFITQAPAGDPAPAAWARRMCFWTAVHEMGHSFNLAHAWQKASGTPWIPLANEPESRSFMNYPFRVSGSTPAFFANFEYRFSDRELLFLRHAPERFVQMGNADWFDHHGFQQDRVALQPQFRLELIPPRKGASFEFLEPVVLDLRLTNVSNGPQLVEEKLLAEAEHFTVIIKKHGRPARQYAPYARKCWEHKECVLQPGQWLRDSLFLSAGQNGWDIAEPGHYTIQVALHLEEEDILSEPLTLRVSRPQSYDEEKLAADYFSEEVGRVLAFDGTRELADARDTLREVAARLAHSRAALHARIALGCPLARRTRTLELGQADDTGLRSAAGLRGCISLAAADERQAREDLQLLVQDPHRADETLGRVDFTYYVNRFQDLLDLKKVLRSQEADDSDLPKALAARLKSVRVNKAGKSNAKKGAAA